MQGDVPTLTLEMRIQPVIRQMVSHMLLNEVEIQDEIYRAAQAAVVNFHWKEELTEMVQKTLRSEVEQLMRGLVSRLAYDEELKPLFVSMLKKIIEQQL